MIGERFVSLSCAILMAGCASRTGTGVPRTPAAAVSSPPSSSFAIGRVSSWFDTEPNVRVLITRTTGALTVSGNQLRIDGEGGTERVRVEIRRGSLTSTDDVCTGDTCVFTAPDGVTLSGAGALPGRLELLARDDELLAVLELPIEIYLNGVVSAEIPGSWDIEVEKAQAVAARSYALAHLGGHEASFDVMSTTLDQVYRPRENPTAVAAVGATRGQVLTSEGAVVEAFYHSTCGGHTEDPSDVWPEARAFQWSTVCSTCAESPHFQWEIRLQRSAVAAAHAEIEHVDELRLEERLASGRVSRVALVDGETSVSMPATEFRRAIGTSRIRSALFVVEASRGAFTLRGRGFGHGVGMCQWGAHGLVDAGRDYLEVLAHYYRGATVHRVYE